MPSVTEEPIEIDAIEIQADIPAEQPLPDLTSIATLVFVAAAAVWAILEFIKPLFRKYVSKEKAWYTSALRGIALLVGAAMGTSLYGSLVGVGSGWPWGTALGAGAGGLCTILVAALKRKIKAIQ